MGRIADSTIKGFMYQFNLSLNEILKSTNEIVKIEGIIEDIDRIKELMEELKGIRKTAISRWTRELSNYKELLTSRRKQLGKSWKKRIFHRLIIL